jgi:hypothetical protein
VYIEIGFMEKRRDVVLKELATLLAHVDGYGYERRMVQASVEGLLRDALNFCRTLNEDIVALQAQLEEERDAAQAEFARLERRCVELAQPQ